MAAALVMSLEPNIVTAAVMSSFHLQVIIYGFRPYHRIKLRAIPGAWTAYEGITEYNERLQT